MTHQIGVSCQPGLKCCTGVLGKPHDKGCGRNSWAVVASRGRRVRRYPPASGFGNSDSVARDPDDSLVTCLGFFWGFGHCVLFSPFAFPGLYFDFHLKLRAGAR